MFLMKKINDPWCLDYSLAKLHKIETTPKMLHSFKEAVE